MIAATAYIAAGARYSASCCVAYSYIVEEAYDTSAELYMAAPHCVVEAESSYSTATMYAHILCRYYGDR